MRGELFLIRQKLLKEEKSPIAKKISNKEPDVIIDTILDEYWKHFNRKMQFTTKNCLIATNLGSFVTDLSKLKGYIRKLIIKIRKLRKRIEVLQQNPDYNPLQSMTYMIERDLTKKLGFAWKQLDERRELMIMRYLRYYHRCRLRGEHHKIKYDYEWYGFKFLKKYGYNSNIFKNDLVIKK